MTNAQAVILAQAGVTKTRLNLCKTFPANRL